MRGTRRALPIAILLPAGESSVDKLRPPVQSPVQTKGNCIASSKPSQPLRRRCRHELGSSACQIPSIGRQRSWRRRKDIAQVQTARCEARNQCLCRLPILMAFTDDRQTTVVGLWLQATAGILPHKCCVSMTLWRTSPRNDAVIRGPDFAMYGMWQAW